MAASQANRALNKPLAPSRQSTETKVAQALREASEHAKKQLSLQGYKLPTQSWTGSAIRNPAV